jgi:flagellar motor switch protein FliG
MKDNTPSPTPKGARKAAILLLSIDEETASEILKELDEPSILAIGDQVIKMVYGVPPGELREIQTEVAEQAKKAQTNYVTGDSARRLSAVLGQSVEEIRNTLGPSEFLRRYDSKAIAQVLRDEHPQTVAVVLASMEAKKARDILEILPGDLQFQVMMRLASVDKVNRSFLGEIEKTIAEQLQRKEIGTETEVGGVQAVAAIFNKLGKDLGSKIMSEIEEKDENLAGKIKKLMFTFEDLRGLDDRSMQVVLKEVTSEDLVLALKQTSEELKQKIFANMSERAAAILREDMETHGRVRISDVEAAQSKIAVTAKRLADEGKIVVASVEEQFV